MTTQLLRGLRIAVILALLLAMSVGTAAAAGGSGRLTATLTGAAEVPGPGDPDGVGRAVIWLNAFHNQVCWKIRVAHIVLPASAAHIHVGSAEVAGPVVVTLSPPDGHGFAHGCTTASRDLIEAILAHPDQYYVNVHNSVYPAGAVRGQLSP